MENIWLNRVFPIAAIFSFRMLGLFMLIPVFSIYANELAHATPALMGIALGCYGLSQGLLQIPFGMLSDRLGRKPIITLGLLLFVVGSLLGAYTDSIYGMIIARTIQGMGAIGSVLIALLADLTPDESRTKAMAVIGVAIGMSFSIAMVVSPMMTHYFGLHGIFYLTALLATIGLLLLHLIIPTPTKEPFNIDNKTRLNQFGTAIRNGHLLRLNAGIFCQHLILTSTFFAIPMILQQHVKLGYLSEQWHFYLPLMITAFLAMVPFIIIAEKKQKMKAIFLGSVAITGLSQLILAYAYASWLMLCGLMLIYFIAFNILEASLPSLVSKQADAANKGTAMGIYSSSQFLGIFAGGALSGVIFQLHGSQGIFIVNSIIAVGWFLVSVRMQPNCYLLTLIIPYHTFQNDEALMRALRNLSGVEHVAIVRDENRIYLRADKSIYKDGSAEKVIINCS